MDDRPFKISKNNLKCSKDLRSIFVTQDSVKNHQLKLV